MLAYCTVGQITLFLHKCKYSGGAFLHTQGRDLATCTRERLNSKRQALAMSALQHLTSFPQILGQTHQAIAIRFTAECFASGAMFEPSWRHMQMKRARRSKTSYERMRG